MDFKPFKIGKFLLLERLATGGMAEVYRAKASGAGGFEKQLAIKRILPNYSANEEFRKMFEYEARLSSMLTHANIVQIYDFVKSGETYLLAMEYVDGKNLRQFINKVKKLNYALPVQFGVFLINEVCKGLEYAHKKKDDISGRPLNIIHRDMSPQNIMLSYDGAVKIVDFGIAKAKDRVDETRSGVIKGKFGYMSPEQANGESVDHRTDIFSTGIILFELLTMKRLFAAENDMATLKLIQECVIAPPSRTNPKIPVELEKILLKSLAKDRNLRYQSAGDFQRGLQEYLSKHFSSFTQKDLSDAMQRIFADEIGNEKRRFEQIHRQSIPFSQGAQKESTNFDDMEEALDGEMTKSEEAVNTAVTSSGDDAKGSDDEDSDVPREFVLEEDDEGTPIPGSMSAVEPIPDPSVSKAATGPSVSKQSLSENTTPNTAVGEPLSESAAVSAGALSEESHGLSVPTEPLDSGSLPGLELEPRPGPSSTSGSLSNEATIANVGLSNEGSMPMLTNSESAASEPGEKTVATKPSIEVPIASKSPTTLKPMNASSNQRSVSTSLPKLETPNPDVGRRRDRSFSQPSERESGNRTGRTGQSGNSPSISIQSNSEAPNTQSNVSSGISLQTNTEVKRPLRKEERFEFDEFNEPKTKSFATIILFFLIVGGTAYLYRLYLTNQMPEVFSKFNLRELSQKPPEAPQTEPPKSELQGLNMKPGESNCALELSTDPAGAHLIVENEVKGDTPTTFPAPCNESFNITLRLDGYEPVSENIFIRNRSTKFYKTLQKIPTGTLELDISQNAQISIDGGPFERSVAANTPTRVPIRANKKVKVRFKNEVFGVDVIKEFSVPADVIVREKIRFEEGSFRTR